MVLPSFGWLKGLSKNGTTYQGKFTSLWKYIQIRTYKNVLMKNSILNSDFEVSLL